MDRKVNSLDSDLRRRAMKVVPGGMWGHMNAAALPEGYPQFFARGSGSRLWDVDGNEYVDFMCSWGPVVLGHHHPEVDDAAQKRASPWSNSQSCSSRSCRMPHGRSFRRTAPMQ